ncbi:GNAT family N-acetyltransferase [Pararhizobium sp. YC-54]|uniref:GNAT family N-acetyltransferase n=1 Tax=Pararhizobium sp. YC-54 TaxID=2986920 RepID=UPI0021F73867|nr:GNAT family N-acetyltransferase [Pararhizobium sp. YC-54]MCV9999106.1 GNAT family N-acetyltransferase [Pararhizobium sp. YC-54]
MADIDHMDQPFEIRPGTGDDLFMIAGVLVDTWRSAFRGLLADGFLDGLSREEQAVRHARRMGEPGVSYLVATEPSVGDVIGFANFGPARARLPAHIHELYALYVRAEYQGAGIGRALVRSMAVHCAGQGATSLFAWVLAGNPNRGFYERLGAKAVETGRIGLGDQSYEQVAYLWDDIAALARTTGGPS